MRGMLCFVVEDIKTLREVNVEDAAGLQQESSAVQTRVAHATSHAVPQLWLVSADGATEELIGDTEALNQQLSNGALIERLQRFGIPHLLDLDDFL